MSSTWATCVFTVASLTCSATAISWFVWAPSQLMQDFDLSLGQAAKIRLSSDLPLRSVSELLDQATADGWCQQGIPGSDDLDRSDKVGAVASAFLLKHAPPGERSSGSSSGMTNRAVPPTENQANISEETDASDLTAGACGKRNAGAGCKLQARSEMATREHWKEESDAHDYPAAADYLSLVMTRGKAEQAVRRLRAARLEHRKAKDLLRASGLPELPPDNVHVAKDLARVRKGEMLAPVLLVRGRLEAHILLTVADGYHRICASYHLNEDAAIPCRIADISKA